MGELALLQCSLLCKALCAYVCSPQHNSEICHKPLQCYSSEVVVQSLSCVWLFASAWPAACQASLHYLLEFAQTHVHWVGDAIQPSHPLSSPSPLPSVFPSKDLFQWVSSVHQVAKVLEPQHQFFQWGLIFFRIDWFDCLGIQGTLKNLIQHHSLKVSIL